MNTTPYWLDSAAIKHFPSLHEGLHVDACVLGVMFSLFDAGIECHLKEAMCWSSSGLHRPAVKIIRAQFPATR